MATQGMLRPCCSQPSLSVTRERSRERIFMNLRHRAVNSRCPDKARSSERWRPRVFRIYKKTKNGILYTNPDFLCAASAQQFRHRNLLALPSPRWTNCSQVDVMGLRYKSIKLGPGKSPDPHLVSLNDCKRPRSCSGTPSLLWSLSRARVSPLKEISS